MFTVRRKRISDSFLTNIHKARQSLANVSYFAGRLVVPEQMKWWYWQEFGTATRGEKPYASGQTYSIAPVVAKALRWPNATVPTEADGSRIQSFVIAHPGIPPHRFVQKSLRDVRLIASSNLHDTLKGGVLRRLHTVRLSLIQKTMVAAKNRISQEIAAELPGTRPDGKLFGGAASVAWLRHVRIVDTTGSGEVASEAQASSVQIGAKKTP